MSATYNAAASTAVAIAAIILLHYLTRYFPPVPKRWLLQIGAATWFLASAATTVAWFVAYTAGQTWYGRLVQNWVNPTGRIAAALTITGIVHARRRELRSFARHLTKWRNGDD